MEGTGSPCSSTSLARRDGQADERAPLCASCVPSTGLQGSGPTPTFQQGKSVTFFVPSESSIMGSVTPSSFQCCDVAPWVRAEREGVAEGTATGQLFTTGSVKISRLRWGSQGPTPRHSAQDGYLEVRVDRHGSHVGNPFVGAPIERLCRAYDDLLVAVLTVPLQVDDGLREYEDLRRDAFLGDALLTDFEKALLQTISEKHRVRVHRQRVRPLVIRAWLVYHAGLLARGQSLCLLCWCTCGACELAPWLCHAQSLMGALLWFSHTRYDELAAMGALPSGPEVWLPSFSLPWIGPPSALLLPTLF